MSSRLPAPASLSRSGIVLAFVAAALYVIARSTGAGWDVVILCSLIAVLAVGAVWPAVTLRGLGATATAPQDATVGRPIPVEIGLTGRARGLRVRILTGESEWHHADAPCAGALSIVATRRGVVTGLVVEIRSSSPLGLVAWRRRVRIELARPLEIAPKVIPTSYEPTRGADRQAEARPRARTNGQEDTRGVRDYVDGDPIRLVHWPATARTGAVMVRELEGPQRPRLIVMVDLRGDPADVEIAASRAAGLAIAALAKGTLVDLATVEPRGTANGEVRSALEVGRRLARAVPGSPMSGAVAAGTDVRVVRSGSLV